MATESVKAIDSLSKVERELVVDALELRLQSLRRGAKASKIPAVVTALEAEAVSTEALLLRFR